MFNALLDLLGTFNLIPYLLCIPLGTALILVCFNVPCLKNRINLREGIILASGVLLFSGMLFQHYVFKDIRLSEGDLPLSYVFANVTTDTHSLLNVIQLSFKIEPMGMLFALIAALLWPVATLYSIGYMRKNQEHGQLGFYLCFAIAIFAVLGIAFAANMFTLFCFYELLSLSTFPLVTHKGSAKAMKAGRIYLGVLIGASIALMLPAIIWTHQLTGSTDFTNAGILKDKISGWPLSLLLALYVFGIAKAAIMPFHKWLPTAMIAPTPVSALLHAVAVVKAGVFTLLKVVVYIFGLDFLKSQAEFVQWFLYITAFTLVSSSIIAALQDNLKKRLAYSTISQLAYITMAASLFNGLAMMGAMIHIASHAFGKITLFFAAGCIYTASHKTEISQLDGLAQKMPITFFCFALGSLSMMGLPPLAGFISKWYLLQGAWDSASVIAFGAIIVSTLLNVVYLLPIVYRGFWGTPKESLANLQDAPKSMLIAMSFTALASVMIFMYPNWLIRLTKMFVGGVV